MGKESIWVKRFILNLCLFCVSDLSGDAVDLLFSYRLPVISSESGATLIVVPGKFGVAVHHPNIDENENSVVGVHIATQLSEGLASFV